MGIIYERFQARFRLDRAHRCYCGTYRLHRFARLGLRVPQDAGAADLAHGAFEGEFTARDATTRETLQDYLDREERLFRELRVKIYDRLEPTAETTYSRYRAGGLQDPHQLPRNWNRTFELVPGKASRGGVLLLHGLTDSPYSLRRIGEIFYAKGFYVLGLRLPGHGTIPGALTDVRWEDWVAASRIGARHVRERIGPDSPFVIAGYSNGGALAVKYCLDALPDPGLPPPDRLLLFSPEIGITPFGRHRELPQAPELLPYFAKFKWLSIEARVRPLQVQLLPQERRPAGLRNHGRCRTSWTRRSHRQAGEFPPVLTFLSWIDATVETPATIDRLYDQARKRGQRTGRLRREPLRPACPFIRPETTASLERLEDRSDLPTD